MQGVATEPEGSAPSPETVTEEDTSSGGARGWASRAWAKLQQWNDQAVSWVSDNVGAWASKKLTPKGDRDKSEQLEKLAELESNNPALQGAARSLSKNRDVAGGFQETGTDIARKGAEEGTRLALDTAETELGLKGVGMAAGVLGRGAKALKSEVQALRAEERSLAASGGPGSAAHRAARWQEYQARGGEWSYEHWNKVYEQNMGRATRAHKAADAYHQSLGWGRREVTVDVEGVPRRLDIADEATLRGREVKTGYQSASQENLWEIQRDQILREKGWDIQWRFEGRASRQLREALEKAGVPYTGGTR